MSRGSVKFTFFEEGHLLIFVLITDQSSRQGRCGNGGIFYFLGEAEVIIEMWQKALQYSQAARCFGYRPPAPETIALLLSRLKIYPNLTSFPVYAIFRSP